MKFLTTLIKLIKRNYVYLFVIFNILPLLSAYLMEYFSAVHPCPLCWYQRYCYMAGLTINGTFLALFGKQLIPSGRKSIIYRRIIFYLTNGSLMLINLFFALQQSLLERGIQLLPATCSSEKLAMAVSSKELMSLIMQQNNEACDQIQWSFLGLSIANWNVVYLTIMICTLATVIISHKNKAK